MMFFVEEEEEETKHSSSCGLLASAVKDTFAHCYVFPNGRRPPAVSGASEDDDPESEVDDDERVIILAVRKRMIKGRLGRKNRLMTKSLSWAFSPSTGEVLYVAPILQAFQGKLSTKDELDGEKDQKENEDDDDDDDEEEEEEEGAESFYTVRSRFSRSSSAGGGRVGEEQRRPRRRSVFEEFCECEGWPFGLYRKSLILPPLPSSPSEPWTWCRRRSPVNKMTKPLP